MTDIPEDFFWEVKKYIVENQLKQKSLVAVAIREYIGSEYPLSDIVLDDDELAHYVNK